MKLNNQRKLNNKQVKEIREKYKEKLGSQFDLAIEYGISTKSIWEIVNYKSYKEIPKDK